MEAPYGKGEVASGYLICIVDVDRAELYSLEPLTRHDLDCLVMVR